MQRQRPGQIGARVGPELDARAPSIAHRGGEGRVVTADVPLGGSRRRAFPGLTLLHHLESVGRDAGRRDDAAVTRVGSRPCSLTRLGVGRDVADLAQQVDALLDVAYEVAAGELVVVQYVGERVA